MVNILDNIFFLAERILLVSLFFFPVLNVYVKDDKETYLHFTCISFTSNNEKELNTIICFLWMSSKQLNFNIMLKYQ